MSSEIIICAIIDCDLQDPPELIYEMYKKIMDGNDVVYAKRTKRKGETSPPFPEVILNHGDKMDCPTFPRINISN